MREKQSEACEESLEETLSLSLPLDDAVYKYGAEAATGMWLP